MQSLLLLLAPLSLQAPECWTPPTYAVVDIVTVGPDQDDEFAQIQDAVLSAPDGAQAPFDDDLLIIQVDPGSYNPLNIPAVPWDIRIEPATPTPLGPEILIEPASGQRGITMDHAGLAGHTTFDGIKVRGAEIFPNVGPLAGGAGALLSGARALFVNCAFEDNEALNLLQDPGLGGGMRIANDSAVCIEDSTFLSNAADDGAGVHLMQSDLTVYNTRFDQNVAASALGRGGGIYANSCSQVLISLSEFVENDGGRGAGLYAHDSLDDGIDQMRVQLRDADFFRNNLMDANSEGGGVWISGASTQISPKEFYRPNVFLDADRCRFEQNRSGVGGGVYEIETTSNYDYCEFLANECLDGGGDGGGLYSRRTQTLDVTNSLFDGNVAEFRGGAICLIAGEGGQRFENCLIVNNTAARGGGLHHDSSFTSVTVELCTLSGNTATETVFPSNDPRGADLDLADGVANVHRSILYDATGAPIYLTSSASLNIEETNWPGHTPADCPSCFDETLTPLFQTSTQGGIPDEQSNRDFFLNQSGSNSLVDAVPDPAPNGTFMQGTTDPVSLTPDNDPLLDLGFHYNAVAVPNFDSILRSSSTGVSEALGGQIEFDLFLKDDDFVFPGSTSRVVIMLGSTLGTAPGIPLNDGSVLPLAYDDYMLALLTFTPSPFFTQDVAQALSVGEDEQSWTWIAQPGELPMGASGLTLYHACLVFETGGAVNWQYAASNATRHLIAP